MSKSEVQGSEIWEIEEKNEGAKIKKLFVLKILFNASKLLHEYKILEKLQYCPSICRLHDAFCDQKDLYLVMPLYKHNLSQRIQACQKSKTYCNKEHKEDELQILRWMIQLVDGVEAIHQSKTIHRDLNPRNLFLDDQDQLIIGDFGISTEKTIPDTVTGTIGYFAPEVLRGHGYTASADMYSVGCILLDLLTFTTSVHDLKIETRLDLIPPSYSVLWTAIVGNLLNNPNIRMSATKLKRALFEIQEAKKKDEEMEKEKAKKSLGEEKKKKRNQKQESEGW